MSEDERQILYRRRESSRQTADRLYAFSDSASASADSDSRYR
jgi:hypothetical protein